MKDRRKSKKKRRGMLVLYLVVCTAVIVIAYFHLTKIAKDYNTEHLELISGLYAEKMNETIDYLQSYAKENVKTVRNIEEREPEEILARLERDLDQTVFCDIGFFMKDGEIYGGACAVADLKKNGLDKQVKKAEESFVSEPYQSSKNGGMVMTVVAMAPDDDRIDALYVSVMIENLKKLGIYELLQGKVSVHLLKADSENYITCISGKESTSGIWNNLLLQQKYFRYYNGYSYNDWMLDMRMGVKEGRFTANVRGEDATISYRSISSMPGWYIIVQLANKKISNITQYFSAWGVVYGSILMLFTILYMLTILLMEKKDKEIYKGLSDTDALTGLFNRRAFQAAVDETLLKRISGVFIFIDVDNFKDYNDKYGHANGDLCLKHFAATMKKCFPKDSILGRYGGDEFVVYIKNATSDDAHRYMDEFQREISHLMMSGGEHVTVSASAGGVAFAGEGEDFVSLCRSADNMLYDVKRNGKGTFKMKGAKNM